MTNDPRGSKTEMREQLRCWACLILFASWVVGAPAAWTSFALAQVGTLASADAGRLIAIHGANVTTTTGYFHVSADPSALLGTPLRVVRTNSMWSDSGLQLCTVRGATDHNWCADISDGYAGKLVPTAFAQHAWSHGEMIAIFSVAFFVTLFGWFPAVAIASGADAG